MWRLRFGLDSLLAAVWSRPTSIASRRMTKKAPSSDHQPTLIAEDVLTNPNTKDEYRLGTNRSLSPSLAFPALTVPAGFTSDGLPVGIEFMGRMFSEATLLKLGYAYEQGTHNRRAPALTPALSSEP
jgi:Asp-tRNA(Asn)/Glu-tRNA(Gln) amidotransferase A subunit family amidase